MTPSQPIEPPDPFAPTLERLSAQDRELLERALAARGRVLHDAADEVVGTITGVMIDRETGQPTWLAVERASRAQGLVGVPVAGIEAFGAHYRVPVSAELIHSAPVVSLRGLSAPVEHDLCRHYGVPPTRGAEQPADRRATSSRAFGEPGAAGEVGWLPAPRGQ